MKVFYEEWAPAGGRCLLHRLLTESVNERFLSWLYWRRLSNHILHGNRLRLNRHLDHWLRDDGAHVVVMRSCCHGGRGIFDCLAASCQLVQCLIRAHGVRESKWGCSLVDHTVVLVEWRSNSRYALIAYLHKILLDVPRLLRHHCDWRWSRQRYRLLSEELSGSRLWLKLLRHSGFFLSMIDN